MEPIEPPTTPPPRVPRRTPRACKQCRAAKIKCSGAQPCDRCVRRRDSCTFPSNEPHVSVPERYLRDLQRRVSQVQAQAQASPPATERSESDTALPRAPEEAIHASTQRPSASVPTQAPTTSTPVTTIPVLQQARNVATTDDTSTTRTNSNSLPVPRNPLVARNLEYVRDTNGRPHFLGLTSTWSFCRRALSLLETRTPSSDGTTSPLNLDGAAFHMSWEPKSMVEEEDFKNLPAMDYAFYLYNTAKFHLGELFCVVDEASFMAQFDSFHKNPGDIARTRRLWFVEYLLLLAYGQAFLASGPRVNTPLGSQFATRAMALLPNPAQMNEEPMLAIEVLALVALYLQAVDIRVAAYQYIGQALRFAYVEGLHRQIPDDVVSPEFATRCNNMWWTVYILDQEFTALMGVPPSVPEGSVTVALPIERSSSLPASALTLRIRLSRLIARMCSTVYGLEDGDSFIRSTTGVLHQLADVSRELDSTMSSYNRTSWCELPHMLTHIALLCHHCIVLATRPLVMWLLTLSSQLTALEPQRLVGPIAILLQTSVESAMTITRMLRALAEHNMLSTFLPFQLEYAFSAAMLLSILGTILPSYIPDTSWFGSISLVLDEMMRKQNVVARLRKSELEQLGALLGPVHRHEQDVTQDVSASALADSGGVNMMMSPPSNIDPSLVSDENLEHNEFGLPWDPSYGMGNGFLGNPNQILELADQLEHEDISYTIFLDSLS
ncbi:hypothetical protein AAE478_008047 [Parahypoxylon ruwenzoriense]